MRALVIGATGFVGLNLVDALLARGIRVRATRRPRSVTVFLRRRPVELVHASLEDRGALVDAMRGCDVVFVAGGHYPRYSFDRARAIATGVAQIRSVASAALEAGGRRIVYVSSTGILERTGSGRPVDERDVADACPVESTYRATKWSMERELELWVDRGLDAVTLLPGGCIGPSDVRVGTGALLLGVVSGALPWWVDGITNVVDVGDVAEAAVSAALARHPARQYCLVGQSLRLGTLLTKVAARYGGRLPGAALEPEEARRRADRAEADAAPRRKRVPFPRELVDLVLAGQPVSSARAIEDLGATFRPLDESLDRAWAWFVRHRYLPALRAMEGVT